MESFVSPQIEKRLTQHAKNAIENAYKYSVKDELQLSPDYILYAISAEKGSLGAAALATCGIQIKHSKKPSSKTKKVSEKSVYKDIKKILKVSAQTAKDYKHNFIGTEHILYGLTKKDIKLASINSAHQNKLQEYLQECFGLNAISNASIDLLKSPNNIIAKIFVSKKIDKDTHKSSNPFKARQKKYTGTSILEKFCENLSDAAKKGSLDPLIGREQELDRIIRILIRRTKNNPLLIGEPGVGKTALVHGLAQKIHKKDVPIGLMNKKLFSLNLNSLIAGTTFRGEFEERMHHLVREASNNDIILFVDEIHTIVGAGSAQGSLDVANIIKPALVKGSFQCIGATTFEEFKKSIEKDSALDRRFQKIPVYEESKEQSMQTLGNLKNLYEEHHKIKISQEIISLCVDLSYQYLPHRSLPDKALDILDEASSKMHAKNTNNVTNAKIKRIKKELAMVRQLKEVAKEEDNYEYAKRLHIKQEKLEKDLNQEMLDSNKGGAKLTKDIIYEVLSEMTSIPVHAIEKNSNMPLAGLVKKEVIGQDKAIEKISYAIDRNRSGIRDTSRPIGSFLFSGSSGVGKSHLAKILAKNYTNTDKAFIQLDMSEFSEAHTISKLIGSPAGYIGYEEAGVLTKKIRQNPGAVVLFDEIEKAHPNVLNVLLQILEDGILTDSHDRTASFKNSIIIMTTNIGSEGVGSSIGFSKSKNKEDIIKEKLGRIIKKEIINRIDEIILFNQLSQKDLEKIADNQLQEIKTRISSIASLSYNKKVPLWIALRAKDEDKGARAIRSVIRQEIESEIASLIMNKNISELKASVAKDAIKFRTS